MKPILQGMALITAFAVVALLTVVALSGGWPQSSGPVTASAASPTASTGTASTPAESATSAATPTATPTNTSQAAPTTAQSAASGTENASTQSGGVAIKVGTETLMGNAQAGLNVYERSCVSCHNRAGQAYIPQYPRLSAQVASYTAEQLHAFATGTRANAIMTPIAQGFTPQQMADIAAYLATTPASKDGWGSVNEELHARGKELYQQGNGQGAQACMACHGASGEGQAAAGYPHVAGQSPTYFVKRMGEFASLPASATGNVAIMAKIAKALSADETRAIGEYLKTIN